MTSKLKASLAEQMKAAMKAGEKEKLSYIRNLHAAIRKKEIDDQVELDDSGVIQILVSLVKQRRDSMEQFQQGGREDLVAAEKLELTFLQTFLPPPISESELKKIIAQAIAETQATSIREMKQVMELVLPQVQSRADGKWVSQLIRAQLELA
jgi:hypothetical protein